MKWGNLSIFQISHLILLNEKGLKRERFIIASRFESYYNQERHVNLQSFEGVGKRWNGKIYIEAS